jgi:hypothetical protein
LVFCGSENIADIQLWHEQKPYTSTISAYSATENVKDVMNVTDAPR